MRICESTFWALTVCFTAYYATFAALTFHLEPLMVERQVPHRFSESASDHKCRPQRECLIPVLPHAASTTNARSRQTRRKAARHGMLSSLDFRTSACGS
jgi:hypothetical protein